MSSVAPRLLRLLRSSGRSSGILSRTPASNAWDRLGTGFRMASTLPRLPVFEAIARHAPDSTVVVHSQSGRRFRYGELLGDVCKVRNRLYEAAGRDDINGERVAFLVENSYDYVGKWSKRVTSISIPIPLSSFFLFIYLSIYLFIYSFFFLVYPCVELSLEGSSRDGS